MSANTQRTALIISVLALLVSICAAGFSFWQGMIARDTAQKQLRAYASVTKAKLHEIGVNIIPLAQIAFDNVGQTPGYNAAWAAGLNIIPALPGGVAQTRDCVEIMSRPESKHWYFGKQLFLYTWRDTAYSPADITAINEGTAYILFTGRFCYEDIFHENHHTDFCLYWQSHNSVLEYEEPHTCQYKPSGTAD